MITKCPYCGSLPNSNVKFPLKGICENTNHTYIIYDNGDDVLVVKTIQISVQYSPKNAFTEIWFNNEYINLPFKIDLNIFYNLDYNEILSVVYRYKRLNNLL